MRKKQINYNHVLILLYDATSPVNLTLLLEILHCARNLSIIHWSASKLVNNL